MATESSLSLTRFLRWWFGELRACIPGPLRRALFGGDRRIVVSMADADLGIATLRQGKTRELGRIPLGEVRSNRGAARRLLRRDDLGGAPVTLRLPEGKVLRPRIGLPVEAAETLRDVVALDMDRHTPFSASEVYFDLHVAGLDTERQRLEVDLAVARRSDVEDALATVRTMGFQPDTVSVPSAPDQGDEFNLLPPDQRPRRSHVIAYANGALAAACCGLLLMAALRTVDRKERTAADFEAKLAELRASSSEADRLGERLDVLIALSGQLIDEKTARASMVSVIDEVTQRIPDESWLTSYTFQAGSVEMTGYSDDPSEVLRQLEASEIFSEVRFTAPVTIDSRIGRERFNIAMTVSQRGAQR